MDINETTKMLAGDSLALQNKPTLNAYSNSEVAVRDDGVGRGGHNDTAFQQGLKPHRSRSI